MSEMIVLDRKENSPPNQIHNLKQNKITSYTKQQEIRWHKFTNNCQYNFSRKKYSITKRRLKGDVRGGGGREI